VAELNSLPARDRLELFLCRLAHALQPATDGADVRLVIPLFQREIAQLIGVTPSYLSDLVRALEERGTVRREKDSIVLCRDGGGRSALKAS
jgi:CRP-like cAMP-binding protein